MPTADIELKRSRPPKLTDRQEKFATLVAGGMKPAWAYRRCYSSRGSAATVAVDSSRLRHHPLVAARILELRPSPASNPQQP